MTETLLMLTRFADDGEVVEWFRVVREARDAGGDPADFPERLRELATGFDQSMVEEFLRALADTGDTERSVDELVELESRMPDLYWAYHPREEPAEHAETAEHAGPAAYAEPAEHTPFGWVDGDQAAQLEAAWGDWRLYLGDQLAARWGADWESHPDEHKHAWFTDLLPELLNPTEPEPEPAEPTGGAVPAAVLQEASAILDQLLSDELAALDADSELSEADLNEIVAELRAELLTEG